MESSLNMQAAKAGWGKFKEIDFKEESMEEYGALMRSACAQAEQTRVGIYQHPDLAKKFTYDLPVEALEELAATSLKQKRGVKAIIEYCRDGSSFRVTLVDLGTTVQFALAGVQSVRTVVLAAEKPAATEGGVAPPQQAKDDPLAAEAKRFTETRLLQREVTLDFGGFDPSNRHFYGSVRHSNGNIAEELVKVGLGKVVDWSLVHLSDKDEAPKLRAMQRDAQAKKLGAWKEFVSKSASLPTSSKEFEGVISEISSGDTVFVRICPSNITPDQQREMPWLCEERRISLSSIQAPRLGSKNSSDPSMQTDAKYAVDSREYLRSKFMGAKVKVSLEYSREPKPSASGAAPAPGFTRYFGTVSLLNKANTNVALELVKQGLAEVSTHRADDDRSAHYDDLLSAQNEAKLAKRNIFSSNEPPAHRRFQLAGDATKAKAHLPHLQRERDARLKCVVEWVNNGSRFGMDLPTENCVLSFALVGVSCPSTAKRNLAGSKDEPFAKEALAFTRAVALNQNGCKVRIETMDRAGTFLGSLLVPFKNQEEVSLSVLLLERGLGKVVPFSADQSKYRQQLYDAEALAKSKRLGVWNDWSPEAEAALAAASQQTDEPDTSKDLTYTSCSIVDVVNGNTVFVRWETEKAKADLRAVELDMERIASQGSVATDFKRGSQVCAAFDDGTGVKYYRARVEFANSSEPKVRVFFLDYGNEAQISRDRLKAPSSATKSISPLANQHSLVFVLPGPGFERDAAICLSDLVFNKPSLKGCVTKSGLVLLNEALEEQTTVNEVLVREGLAYVRGKDIRFNRIEALKPVADAMLEAQERAHRSHLNLWKNGDPRGDDDE